MSSLKRAATAAALSVALLGGGVAHAAPVTQTPVTSCIIPGLCGGGGSVHVGGSCGAGGGGLLGGLLGFKMKTLSSLIGLGTSIVLPGFSIGGGWTGTIDGGWTGSIDGELIGGGCDGDIDIDIDDDEDGGSSRK